MAMTPDALSAQIKAGIIAQMGTPADGGTLLQKFCDGIAGVSASSGIVPYIKAAAVIPLGILVQVTPASGTGATSGPGTIT